MSIVITGPDDAIWELFERMQAEIAREIRVMLGEEPYDPRIFDESERVRRIAAMKLCAEQNTSDAERHESWMAMHRENGWTYGPVLNKELKQHPNMLPWEELPLSTRSKTKIFDICSRYADEMARAIR